MIVIIELIYLTSIGSRDLRFWQNEAKKTHGFKKDGPCTRNNRAARGCPEKTTAPRRRDEPDLISAKEVALGCESGPGARSGGRTISNSIATMRAHVRSKPAQYTEDEKYCDAVKLTRSTQIYDFPWPSYREGPPCG